VNPSTDLDDVIDAALGTIDRALAKEMRTIDGESAASQLERLRDELHAVRARGEVTTDELRAMIRAVAKWAPEDDVSLLSSLGMIVRARG
jgi:hypothetical protein